MSTATTLNNLTATLTADLVAEIHAAELAAWDYLEAPLVAIAPDLTRALVEAAGLVETAPHPIRVVVDYLEGDPPDADGVRRIYNVLDVGEEDPLQVAYLKITRAEGTPSDRGLVDQMVGATLFWGVAHPEWDWAWEETAEGKRHKTRLYRTLFRGYPMSSAQIVWADEGWGPPSLGAIEGMAASGHGRACNCGSGQAWAACTAQAPFCG